MTTYPNGPVLPIGATQLLSGDDANIWYTSPDGSSKFYLGGALQPWPGIQDGIIMAEGSSGFSPGFHQITMKTARMAGVVNTGTVYDELKMNLKLQAHGRTPQSLAAMVSEWIASWDPTKEGTFEYITLDQGYWYFKSRLAETWPDTYKKLPRTVRVMPITQQIVSDASFWFGMPSIDTFHPGGTGGTGFLTLVNTGSIDANPSLLFYGPGTLEFSNGDNFSAPNTITFGPLLPGQVAMITIGERRQVVDLTPTGATVNQALTAGQKFVENIVNSISNNNVPPMLQQMESAFGIVPPQGSMYSLMKGRYTQAIPGVTLPTQATGTRILVSITGGDSNSKVIGRIDPARTWPG